MTGILLSKGFVASFGEGFAAAAREAGLEPPPLNLPDDPKSRLAPADCARIEIAYLSRDWRFSDHYQTFGDTVRAASRCATCKPRRAVLRPCVRVFRALSRSLTAY